jgi:glutathione S-transferase
MRYWVKHEEDELFLAVRPASLNLMMKQIYGRYGEEELDTYLAHHPRPHMIGRLKKMFRAPPDADAVEKSRDKLRRAFLRMDENLRADPWLAGQSYSLADIAAAPVIDRVRCLGMDDLWRDLTGLADWIRRLEARSAYQAALPPDAFRLPGPIRAA